MGDGSWSRSSSGRAPLPWALALLLLPWLVLWTLPQSLAGLMWAGLKRVRGGVRPSLYRFGPFLFLVVPEAPFSGLGISLGVVVLAGHPRVLTHEFCHLYSGLWLGWLYLPTYGLEYALFGHSRSPHERITVRLEGSTRWAWERTGRG
ncbi:MAG: hypothetical protein HY901_35850 [Deltaproteobacteria bacterium]|nr:hypothetical protein [Deltaproteobacteria bacterium]